MHTSVRSYACMHACMHELCGQSFVHHICNNKKTYTILMSVVVYSMLTFAYFIFSIYRYLVVMLIQHTGMMLQMMQLCTRAGARKQLPVYFVWVFFTARHA